MQALNHSSDYKATMVLAKTHNLTTMVDYWQRISAALKHARITQKELQEGLKISYQAMKKLEDGKTKSLSAENNARAARILDVNSYWLATGEETMLQARQLLYKSNFNSNESPSIHRVSDSDNLIPSSEPVRALADAPSRAWPFKGVSQDDYQKLDDLDRAEVEGFIKGLLRSGQQQRKSNGAAN